MRLSTASSISNSVRPARPGDAAHLLRALLCAGIATVARGAFAQDLSSIGVTLLRSRDATLTGAGLRIAQPEAGAPNWEVNPSTQPNATFNYYGSGGASSAFTNSLGLESSHADIVGSYIYGNGGVAPGVVIVDNYDANYYESAIISASVSIPAILVNQSFVNDSTNSADQANTDSIFDQYAAQYGVLFISGAGNSGMVASPASCYNGIGVAAYGGNTAVGPTPDNGRCKPDITAPAGFTSLSTALVTGSAAILWQAGGRGDGGAGTSSLVLDPKVLKALLLNGAAKPGDWSHTTASPLDFRYGAGILDVFNSWTQLRGGRVAATDQTSVPSGAAHPPSTAKTPGATLTGWDNASVSTDFISDGVNDYYFQVGPGSAAGWTLTATLVWEKEENNSTINNLDLFLYRVADGSLAASSQSAVDNVEHIYAEGLAEGEYDLQIVNLGGAGPLPSSGEPYGLAFSFTTGQLSIQQGANGPALSWPVYPDGQTLQATATLGAGINWTNVSSPPMVTNKQNLLNLGGLGSAGFFRLSPP
jgi:hypothetical protein